MHLLHAAVARLRGFGPATRTEWKLSSPEDTDRWIGEHNEMILERIAAVSSKRSMVIFHGDLTSGSVPALREFLAILAKMPGERDLFLGNHCPAHPSNGSKGLSAQKLYAEAFSWVATEAQMRFAGTTFTSSHFPYEGDHQDQDRYQQFRLPDLGLPILHGHVHDEWKVRLSAAGTPMINVGVDVWRERMANMEELAELMGAPVPS